MPQTKPSSWFGAGKGSAVLDRELDVVVLDAGAGAPLDPIADLFPDLLQRLGLGGRPADARRRATSDEEGPVTLTTHDDPKGLVCAGGSRSRSFHGENLAPVLLTGS